MFLALMVSCRSSPSLTTICDIQGGGYSSPYLGEEVQTRGVVSGDFEDRALSAFFIQDPDCSLKIEASQGLLVSHDQMISLVSTGDLVTISGLITEDRGMTTLVADPSSVDVLAKNQDLPAPVDLLDFSASSSSIGRSWEYLEGMMVDVKFLRVEQILDHSLIVGSIVDEEGNILPGGRELPGLIYQVSYAEQGSAEYQVGDIFSGLVGPLSESSGRFFLWGLSQSGHLPRSSEDTPVRTKTPLPEEFHFSPGSKPLYPFSPAFSLLSIPLTAKTQEPAVSPTATQQPLPAGLLITELMPNPPGSEPENEWIEIFNPENYAVQLTHLKLGDAQEPGRREGMFMFPPGTYIESKEVLVIAGEGISFYERYGFFPDFELIPSTIAVLDMVPYSQWADHKLQLSNAGDEVVLLDWNDQVIDAVAYGKSDYPGFQPPAPKVSEGQTLERFPPKQDRDRMEDWRTAAQGSPGWLDRSGPTPVKTGSLTPSPGKTPGGPTSTPVPGYPFLSEVMADPAGAEPGGEWIEIHNPYPFAIPLVGFKIGDAGNRDDHEGMVVFPENAQIMPGASLVIANRAVDFHQGCGFFPDYELSDSAAEVPTLGRYFNWGAGSIRLRNQGDEVLILDRDDQVLDVFAYGDSTYHLFQPPVGGAEQGHSYARVQFNPGPGRVQDWRQERAPSPGMVPSPEPSATPTSTPEPSPTASNFPGPASPSPSPTSTPEITSTIQPGILLLSEVLSDPLGDEPGGEWIEIYNPQSFPFLLGGIKIGDASEIGDREGMYIFPPGAQISPNKVIVIANQAASFLDHYGYKPDFEIRDSDKEVPDLVKDKTWAAGQLILNNEGDEVILLDENNFLLDMMAYGDSTYSGFQPPAKLPAPGCSLERFPPNRDRDSADDWRQADSPSPGWLVWGTSTTQASRTPSQTPTLTLTALPTASATLFPQPTTPVTAAVTPTAHPGSTPTPPASRTPSLTPSVVPSAALTPTGTPVPPPSPTLTPGGSHTPTDAPGGAVLINEIHADPHPEEGDANGDGIRHSDDDEFLEMVNTGGVSLDLSGWTISDAVKVRYVFPEGTLLKAGCPVVVFGGGEPEGEFGGSLVLAAGSLGLNNGGDSVLLRDEQGILQDQYIYGSEGGDDQSLTYDPDLSGARMIKHLEAEGVQGARFSPGTRLDGTPFSACP